MLYCALVQPYLTHCIQVWGNNFKTASKPLETLQKTAMRVIQKVRYLPTHYFYSPNKLKDLVQYSTAHLMYSVSDWLVAHDKNEGDRGRV